MQPIRSIYEDDADMVEIVREFAADLPCRAELLEEQLQSGDLEGLQTTAHQLKGAGGGYGFDPISEVAGRLEQVLHDGQPEGVVKEHCAELCETLRAVQVPEGT
jgi:HPt (histidine-containing phosphotransfer) domain-containing protein